MLRAPAFWQKENTWQSAALWPVALLYRGIALLRNALTRPYHSALPVICVGNVTTGGAGKTPTALALAKLLIAHGRKPAFLTRGYGGRRHGAVRVDPARHTARDVGDEALLLARVAPTVAARNRARGGKLAQTLGVDCLIMDDGFQNPTLHKDISLLVIDGAAGLGNGRLLPAGSLREPLQAALARADAVVIMGEASHPTLAQLPAGKPCLAATLEPSEDAAALGGLRVLAFAGIARPQKFFDTLARAGCDVAGTSGFPDHHRYRRTELEQLSDAAAEANALLITTEKDAARIPAGWNIRVQVFKVNAIFADEAALWRQLEVLWP